MVAIEPLLRSSSAEGLAAQTAFYERTMSLLRPAAPTGWTGRSREAIGGHRGSGKSYTRPGKSALSFATENTVGSFLYAHKFVRSRLDAQLFSSVLIQYCFSLVICTVCT